jgi:hypothetical protein
MLIAGALAAEQRAIVAHSASYGLGRPRILKAPAGAADGCFIDTNIFFRAIRRLNGTGQFSHSVSYGFGCPHVFPAPAGAAENQFDSTRNLPLHPGRGNIFGNACPRLSPWATTVRHSVADTNQFARQL